MCSTSPSKTLRTHQPNKRPRNRRLRGWSPKWKQSASGLRKRRIRVQLKRRCACGVLGIPRMGCRIAENKSKISSYAPKHSPNATPRDRVCEFLTIPNPQPLDERLVEYVG